MIGGSGPHLKRLVVGADNCSGQNKNKAMIKFCCWLVEADWVKKVTFLFLIKDHTKNDVGREFNLLKHGQSGEDIWTANELGTALTRNNKEFINLLRTTTENWKALAKSLNIIYRDPPSGTTYPFQSHFCFL